MASTMRSAVPSTTTSCPSFQVLTPVVIATARFDSRLRAFCSAGPVQNTNDSSCHVPTSGVTCELPSGRTVVIQYSSAAAKSAETSLHAGAQAPGSLNR